ncbi:hypothetical protein ACIP93_33690 [Streptomyces sp. NPDC088745]|uniref:hypothetical protein n=1 Tax=Streptomyces sp. NPDC088745 TaxID=3365884 RepID=UPI00382CC919
MSTPEPSGPVYDFPFVNPFGPIVVLTATVTVDGEPVTVQQQIDRAAWRWISETPPLRADYEKGLRHQLAAAVVDRLAPTITVHQPTPPGGAVPAALARPGAALKNESQPFS